MSNRPDLCQFQCNGAMAAAKQYRKAPIMIAGDVVRRLEADGRFASVTAAAPGFINLTLEDAFLAEQVRAMAADPRLLLPTLKKETVVVDFGGPNVAKPLHVGHLRPAILGDSMCRLARFSGQGRHRRRPPGRLGPAYGPCHCGNKAHVSRPRLF